MWIRLYVIRTPLTPRTRGSPGTENISDLRWKHQTGLNNWFSKVVTLAKQEMRARKYRDVSDTCSERFQMDSGCEQLCKLLGELTSLWLSFSLDKVVNMLSTLQCCEDWCNIRLSFVCLFGGKGFFFFLQLKNCNIIASFPLFLFPLNPSHASFLSPSQFVASFYLTVVVTYGCDYISTACLDGCW